MSDSQPKRDTYWDYPMDKDGSPTPYWLQSVVGSTGEERKRSTPRNFNAYNRRVEGFHERFDKFFNLHYLLSHSDDFVQRLASVEGEYPDLGLSLNINLQRLTGDRVKDLRSFLIYFLSFESIPKWIEFLINEQLDKILLTENIVRGTITSISEGNDEDSLEYSVHGKVYTKRYMKFRQSSQRYIECLTLYKIYTLMGRNHAYHLIESLYSENTIKTWKQKAKRLALNLVLISPKQIYVKEKIRRRGNSHSSSDPNSVRTVARKESIRMKKEEEIQNLEETIQRIKYKQAKLFEKRLDAFLAIENEALSQQERRLIFNSILGGPYEPNLGEEKDKEETPERREDNEENN